MQIHIQMQSSLIGPAGHVLYVCPAGKCKYVDNSFHSTVSRHRNRVHRSPLQRHVHMYMYLKVTIICGY